MKSPLLGVCYKNRNDKKIKDKINKRLDLFFKHDNNGYTLEQQLDMICANLMLLMRKKNIDSLYITGSQMTEEINRSLSIIGTCLKKHDISFMIEKTSLCTVESLEMFAKAEGVLFIEQMNKSLNDDILKEVECCKKYDVDNLGFVIVE